MATGKPAAAVLVLVDGSVDIPPATGWPSARTWVRWSPAPAGAGDAVAAAPHSTQKTFCFSPPGAPFWSAPGCDRR